MRYNKPPLSVQEQINLLLIRNLVINNLEEAELILQNISYYRLSSYLYPFRILNDPKQRFLPGTQFETVIKYYNFDRKLRLLIFDAIERIEVAFRTKLTLAMSFDYGSDWYWDERLFHNKEKFFFSISKFSRSYRGSKEVFIKHYKNKYKVPQFPPSWISLEIFTFGELLNHFSNLKFKSERQKLADVFHLRENILISWLHSINYVRNICAHHSRLWNKSLAIRPKFQSEKNFKWLKEKNLNNNRIYFFLCILQYLLDIVHPNNSFRDQLFDLMHHYEQLDLKPMNFPEDWYEEEFWIKNIVNPIKE